MEVHEAFAPQRNASCYDNSNKKCVWLAAIAKYITIIFTIGYLQNFKAGYFFSSIAIVFNRTKNCDLIYLARLITVS